MAQQLLVWTVLPFGRIRGGEHHGRYRVSIVVSPRLTPDAADEQTLEAFREWLNWPDALDRVKLGLRIGSSESALIPISRPDTDLWKRLFDDKTPVAGFVYKDMSTVNLHSYPVRNVLAFARKNYAQLAVQSASTHPTLLPWNEAHPDLRNMLQDIGTRTTKINLGDRQIEVMHPGFSRFFEGETDEAIKGSVFGRRGIYRMDVPGPDAEEQGLPPTAKAAPRKALSPDWVNPRPLGPAGPLSSAPDAGLMDKFSSADEYTFYQADRFYRRKRPTAAERAKARPDYQDVPPPPVVPEYDFHRIVASYADYGGLMRGLGLVIDCAIEDDTEIRDRINAGGGEGVGQMQLIVDWSGGAPGKDALPRTAWLARQDRFVPRPRTNYHATGFLRLQDCDDGWHINNDERPGLFDLYQVDPDGAAIKTVNFTLTAQNLVGKSLSLRQEHGEVTYTTGNRQSVAALRSAGLGVSQHGRALDLAKAAAAADLKNEAILAGNADKVVLFSEDVHRGYRPDVSRVPDFVQPGDWRTLCAREGEYRLLKTGDEVSFPKDEGYVSGNSVTGDGEGSDEHYMHESLFRWTGWSLVASRPGLTLKSETNDDDQLQAEVPSEVTDTAENGNNVAVSFKAAKGSLPRLRFGSLYRVRARIVDLAGNSLAVDDESIEPLEQASDAVGYWRFEPVDPPVMLHRNRISEGESLERMVIRSNFNRKAAEYLETQDFKDTIEEPAATDFEYTETNQRHFVRRSRRSNNARRTGCLTCSSPPGQIRSGYEIAAREAGTLYDDVPGSDIELVTPTSVAEAATTGTLPPAMPDAANPVGDRMVGGQYIIHREGHVATPYLPDGAAGGVAIRAAQGHTIPGVSGPIVLGPSCQIVMSTNQHLVILVRRGADWPGCDGFRLILAERPESHGELPCMVNFPNDGRPDWKEEDRTLTIFLPKGRIARLVYSSFIRSRLHPCLRHPALDRQPAAGRVLHGNGDGRDQLADDAVPEPDAGPRDAAAGLHAGAGEPDPEPRAGGRAGRATALPHGPVARALDRQVRDRGGVGRMGGRPGEAAPGAPPLRRPAGRDPGWRRTKRTSSS